MHSDTEVVQQASKFAELRPDRLTIHKAPGWLALPYGVGTSGLGDRELNRLEEGARLLGDESLFVVELGLPDDREPRVVRVPAEVERLRETIEKFSLFDIFVLPSSLAWGLLASDLDFSLAIGEQDAVTSLVGMSPDEAIQAFREYPGDWQALPTHIEVLAGAPWETYATQPPGTDLEITWPRAAED